MLRENDHEIGESLSTISASSYKFSLFACDHLQEKCSTEVEYQEYMLF